MTSVCWVDTIASHHMNVEIQRDHLDVINRERRPQQQLQQQQLHNDQQPQQNVHTSTHHILHLIAILRPIVIDTMYCLQRQYQGMLIMIEFMANAVLASDEIAKVLVQVSLRFVWKFNHLCC